MYSSLIWAAVAFGTVTAQFPPPREGVKTVKSVHHEGISISYKEPGICETTPGVKSYSGYVHLPPGSLSETGEAQDYPINTFFWFFESRKDPHNAPLSIWLNGGPGGSSLLGLLAENGPCFVNEDSNSTRLNPWSWNNDVNMLFIDQPVQVGYSYDTLHNGTKSLARSNEMDAQASSITLKDFLDGDIPEQNNTFLVGTFPSQNLTYTANSTEHAAIALWHFAQTWFEEFPVYKPHDEKISLWTESYGGKYGPAFMSFFARQNEKIDNGTISGPGVHYLHLDTLGIINGCVEQAHCAIGYASMLYNNTYGIKAVNETFHHKQMYELERPGGLLDQVKDCQAAARQYDPDEHGDNEYVNQLCLNASHAVDELFVGAYMSEGKHGWFDITHPKQDPFPAMYEVGYLNQHWVQKALGAPVNHSWSAEVVASAFDNTGDMTRGGLLEDLAYLLDNGVKVALVYGDRDYACNWINGELTSLSIPHFHSPSFSLAGYTPLVLSPSTSPPFIPYGLVRQHANLSFTRVYQAGHMVPSYQPAASYEIFRRSLFNLDIATGTVDTLSTYPNEQEGEEEEEEEGKSTQGGSYYATKGPPDTFWRRSELLPLPPHECYVLAPSACTDDERDAIANGTAVVREWIFRGVVEGDGGAADEEKEGWRGEGEQGGQKVLMGGPG